MSLVFFSYESIGFYLVLISNIIIMFSFIVLIFLLDNWHLTQVN